MNRLSAVKAAIRNPSRWLRRSSVKAKAGVAVALLISAILLYELLGSLTLICFFVFACAFRLAGMALLRRRLRNGKTCQGLSRNSQELTALALTLKLILCLSFKEIYMLPPFLFFAQILGFCMDVASLFLTTWVIHKMRSSLRGSYDRDSDVVKSLHVAIVCVCTGLCFKKQVKDNFILDAFSSILVCVDAVSVLPQLVMILQKGRSVEAFTGSYVFCLGMERIFSLVVNVVLFYETQMPSGRLAGDFDYWMVFNLVFQLVHSFILADFCYFYGKALAFSHGVLPSLSV